MYEMTWGQDCNSVSISFKKNLLRVFFEKKPFMSFHVNGKQEANIYPVPPKEYFLSKGRKIWRNDEELLHEASIFTKETIRKRGYLHIRRSDNFGEHKEESKQRWFELTRWYGRNTTFSRKVSTNEGPMFLYYSCYFSAPLLAIEEAGKFAFH